MSSTVAAAVKAVAACVASGEVDDGFCTDVVERLEAQGHQYLCTTLSKLADKFIRSHGTSSKPRKWTLRKASSTSDVKQQLSSRQGGVLFAFALKLAQAAGAGKPTAQPPSKAAASRKSRLRKALEPWQAFTWVNVKQASRRYLIGKLVHFAPLLLAEDERFAESVLAERFHHMDKAMSFLDQSQGTTTLTRVLTGYAEMSPALFFTLLNKYLHSNAAASQVAALVLLQRILGSSHRLLTRINSSGLLQSLVATVREAKDTDIMGLGLWTLVLVLPHTASDTAELFRELLDVLQRSMKAVVQASSVMGEPEGAHADASADAGATTDSGVAAGAAAAGAKEGAGGGAGVGAGAGSSEAAASPGRWRSTSNPTQHAERTLAVLARPVGTLFRCLYALFPNAVLQWLRDHCSVHSPLFPLASSLMSSVRLRPTLVMGDAKRELASNRWKDQGVSVVVTEMQSAEAFAPLESLFADERTTPTTATSQESPTRPVPLPDDGAMYDEALLSEDGVPLHRRRRRPRPTGKRLNLRRDYDDRQGSGPQPPSGTWVSTSTSRLRLPARGEAGEGGTGSGEGGEEVAGSNEGGEGGGEVAGSGEGGEEVAGSGEGHDGSGEQDDSDSDDSHKEGDSDGDGSIGNEDATTAPTPPPTPSPPPPPPLESPSSVDAHGDVGHHHRDVESPSPHGGVTAAARRSAASDTLDRPSATHRVDVTPLPDTHAQSATRRPRPPHYMAHAQRQWLRVMADAHRTARRMAMKLRSQQVSPASSPTKHNRFKSPQLPRSLRSGARVAVDVDELLGRLVVALQELTFERHVARQLARRCRRLQRKAVGFRQSQAATDVLRQQLKAAHKERAKQLAQFHELQSKLQDTQRRYDNVVVDTRATRSSFEREVDRLDRICNSLKLELRDASQRAQQADSAAAAVRMRNMELQAALKQADAALNQQLGAEARAADAERQLEVWTTAYYTHLQPRMRESDHLQFMAAVGNDSASPAVTHSNDDGAPASGAEVGSGGADSRGAHGASGGIVGADIESSTDGGGGAEETKAGDAATVPESRLQALQATVEQQAATIAKLQRQQDALNEKWGKRMQLVESKYSSLKAMHVALQRRTVDVLASRDAAVQDAGMVAGPDPSEFVRRFRSRESRPDSSTSNDARHRSHDRHHRHHHYHHHHHRHGHTHHADQRGGGATADGGATVSSTGLHSSAGSGGAGSGGGASSSGSTRNRSSSATAARRHHTHRSHRHRRMRDAVAAPSSGSGGGGSESGTVSGHDATGGGQEVRDASGHGRTRKAAGSSGSKADSDGTSAARRSDGSSQRPRSVSREGDAPRHRRHSLSTGVDAATSAARHHYRHYAAPSRHPGGTYTPPAPVMYAHTHRLRRSVSSGSLDNVMAALDADTPNDPRIYASEPSPQEQGLMKRLGKMWSGFMKK